jgi:hypothetical protein
MLQFIDRFHAAHIRSVREVVEMDVHQRNDLLGMGVLAMYVIMLHDCWTNLTLLQTICRALPEIVPGALRQHSVPRERSVEGRRADHTRGQFSPNRAGCGEVPNRYLTPLSKEAPCQVVGRCLQSDMESLARKRVRVRAKDAHH